MTSLDDYNKTVDSFDVNGYVHDICQTGAKYVIFTLGQGGFFCSPNKTLNSVCGPVTSHRDLVREIAIALAAHGIRTVVYIPSNPPAVMVHGTQYNNLNDGGPGRRAAFQEIWQRAIAEYGRRWGKLVSGWWIDGMYDWKQMYAFTDGPCYRTLAAACRAGNPQRLVAFNDGLGPYSNHSEYGDWATGEIHRHRQSLLECPGRWVWGVDPATNHSFKLLWNEHTFLGHEFVGNGYGGYQDTPRFPDAYITGFVRRVLARGGTCQLDVPLHMGGWTYPHDTEVGHLSGNFMSQLRAIAHAITEKTPPPMHGSNIALHAPATTNLPGVGAVQAGNDGDIHTDFFGSEDDVHVPWWEIDLRAATPIDAIQIVLGQSNDTNLAYRTEMQIQASNDPNFGTYDVIAWTMEGTFLPPGGSFETYLVHPGTYRYLRVSRPPQSYHVYWWKPALKFAECRVFTTRKVGKS